MSRPVEVQWTFGVRVWGASNLHEVRDRGERVHLKAVGKFIWTPETTAEDIEETVAGWWLLGSLDASPGVREALRARRRWKVEGAASRKGSSRIFHQESTKDGRTTDLSVGRAWFDRLDLETRRGAGTRVDITVYGTLEFAADVSPDLVTSVFDRIKVRGRVRATPAVRAEVRRLVSGHR